MIRFDDHLQVALPLAEMLHSTLGPLSEVLEEEGHPWAPLVKRVLTAYCDGRDDQLVLKYGTGVLKDVGLVTNQVSEEICRVIAEMQGEDLDFEMWMKEITRDA